MDSARDCLILYSWLLQHNTHLTQTTAANVNQIKPSAIFTSQPFSGKDVYFSLNFIPAAQIWLCDTDSIRFYWLDDCYLKSQRIWTMKLWMKWLTAIQIWYRYGFQCALAESERHFFWERHFFEREIFIAKKYKPEHKYDSAKHTHDYVPAKRMDTTWCMNPFIICISKNSKTCETETGALRCKTMENKTF